MAKFAIKHKNEIGLPPDELLFRGEKKMQHTLKRFISYEESQIHEVEIDDISSLAQHIDQSGSVSWINIDGIDNEKEIHELGKVCSISQNLLSDIMNPHQRATIQEYDDALFISLKMLQFDDSDTKVISEQLTIIVKDSLVITFQERQGDVFEPIRERIRKGRKIVIQGSSYLVLAILDIVIDTYLLILSKLGDEIEYLEDELIENVDRSVIERVYSYKKELNYLRKNIIPTRDMIQKLGKIESESIGAQHKELIQDLFSNCLLSVEISDSFREILSDQLTLYHTQVSTKLNDVMKFLTIFSAIFIPLTFIAGIYGTNFDYIPELAFKFSYFIMLGVMVIVAIMMIIIFWKKRWFK